MNTRLPAKRARLREFQEFFEVYKRLEPKKWVKFKEWKNAIEAKKIVNYGIELDKKRSF